MYSVFGLLLFAEDFPNRRQLGRGWGGYCMEFFIAIFPDYSFPTKLQSWTKYIETTAKIQLELTNPEPKLSEGVL